MRAGQAKHQVTFQQNTGTTRDGTGGIVPSWTTHVIAQCRITSTGGQEFAALHRRYAEAQFVLQTTYGSKVAAITPKMRAVFEGRTLEVLANVDQDGRRREALILTKEMDLG